MLMEKLLVLFACNVFLSFLSLLIWMALQVRSVEVLAILYYFTPLVLIK